jgi:hypothetical protein
LSYCIVAGVYSQVAKMSFPIDADDGTFSCEPRDRVTSPRLHGNRSMNSVRAIVGRAHPREVDLLSDLHNNAPVSWPQPDSLLGLRPLEELLKTIFM